MCFHSKQSKEAQEVEHRFKATIEDQSAFKPTEHYNAFTHPKTPIITDEKPELIQHFNWGLIPFWAKDKDIQKYTLNARMETIDKKPSFRSSVDKRCLVIADGFYEWKWLDSKGKQKQKYLLELPNQQLYAYGGIYSEWIDETTGEVINSYTIVTTQANEVVGNIHRKKRMPVVLKPEDEEKWLKKVPIASFGHPGYDNALRGVEV